MSTTGQPTPAPSPTGPSPSACWPRSPRTSGPHGNSSCTMCVPARGALLWEGQLTPGSLASCPPGRLVVTEGPGGRAETQGHPRPGGKGCLRLCCAWLRPPSPICLLGRDLLGQWCPPAWAPPAGRLAGGWRSQGSNPGGQGSSLPSGSGGRTRADRGPPPRPQAAQQRPRRVKQLQFTTWPDHSVPEAPSSLLAFVELVQEQARATVGSGPLLVHCR